MAKAIKKYAGGIHSLIQAAVREDGVIFKRFQNRTHRGYRWGAWAVAGQCDPSNPPATLSAGFSTLYPSDFGVRLPNN